MSESVSSIVTQVYQLGGVFKLARSDGEFYLSSINSLSTELLLSIEQLKEDIYIAIGGEYVEQAEDDTTTEDDTDTGDGIEPGSIVLTGLADLLEKRGAEVLPEDEVTVESLNRHYYHFSTKFDALAEVIREL